ncbi:hypothetical protein PRZ48_004916 [Zasmidium cellare]|uniref:Uncharacterized protein n=1 Tax=Zasmidium cellare TaxID=395010 RepID=A0ABR0EQW2_ZASCE|nr:hypothetical protein PRZ48_004916 [Zasmidium cellare]
MAQRTSTSGEMRSASRTLRSARGGEETATRINTNYADHVRAIGDHTSSLDDSRAQDNSVRGTTPPASSTLVPNGGETVAGGSDSGVVEDGESDAEDPTPVQAPTLPAPAPATTTTSAAAPIPVAAVPPAAAPPAAAPPAAPALGQAPVPQNGPYYTFQEVEQHKNAHDFHHRGKGRWAHGLPGPTAGPQTAVRGPSKYIKLGFESKDYADSWLQTLISGDLPTWAGRHATALTQACMA